MTVRELIEALEKYPDDAQVFVYRSGITYSPVAVVEQDDQERIILEPLPDHPLQFSKFAI